MGQGEWSILQISPRRHIRRRLHRPTKTNDGHSLSLSPKPLQTATSHRQQLTTTIHLESWQKPTIPRLNTEAKCLNSVKTYRRVPSRTPSNADHGCWLHFGSSRPNGSLRCIVPAATRTKLRQSVPNREPIGPDCATTDLEINTGQHDHGYSYSYSRGRKACTRVRSPGYSTSVKGLLRTLPQEKC